MHNLSNIQNSITYDIFNSRGASKFLNKELSAFIKERYIASFYCNTLTFKDVPTQRDKLISQLVQLCDAEIKLCLFLQPPAKPENVHYDCNTNKRHGESVSDLLIDSCIAKDDESDT